MRDHYSEFTLRGAQIIAVGPDSLSVFQEYWARESMPYIGLPDPDRSVSKMYRQQINLFKPFFTTKSQGTGLGLVLSRNLTLKMGGNLEFISNPNQKGASFRLTLPVT